MEDKDWVQMDTLERIRWAYSRGFSGEFLRHFAVTPEHLEVALRHMVETDIYAIHASFDFWGKPKQEQELEYLEYPRSFWHYLLQRLWPERYLKKHVYQIVIQPVYPTIAFGDREHEAHYHKRVIHSLKSLPWKPREK